MFHKANTAFSMAFKPVLMPYIKPSVQISADVLLEHLGSEKCCTKSQAIQSVSGTQLSPTDNQT